MKHDLQVKVNTGGSWTRETSIEATFQVLPGIDGEREQEMLLRHVLMVFYT
jgi:hypothetical protein